MKSIVQPERLAFIWRIASKLHQSQNANRPLYCKLTRGKGYLMSSCCLYCMLLACTG